MSYRTRRRFYNASKLIIRLCLIALALYVAVSFVFYLIGDDEFANFQDRIFSYTLVYLIPFLMLFGLAGTYLFKEDEEEVPPIYRYNQGRKASFNPLVTTLVGVCLVVFAIYNFGFKGSAKPEPVKEANSEEYVEAVKSSRVDKDDIAEASSGDFKDDNLKMDDNGGVTSEQLSQNDVALQNQNNVQNNVDEARPATNQVATSQSAATQPAANQPSTNPPARREVKKDSVITLPIKEDDEDERRPATTSGHYADHTAMETRYKVASKAYLYSAPDEKTRRNAFINANNSYATLIPRGDRNGYIYVVFSNDRGQTTMGWLNKKDLRPVSEMVYNSGK